MEKTNKILKEGLAKGIIYFFLALSLFFVNIFLDLNVFNYSETFKDDPVSLLDYSEDFILPSNGVVRIFNEDEPANIEEVFVDKINKEYVFRLNSGRIWGNFEFSNAKVNILVGNAVVIPKSSRFDLKFEDGRMELSTYNGENYLAFLRGNIENLDFADEFSDRYLNVLLVARDSFVRFTVSKISNDFLNLLPQKLAKTMDVFASISSSLRENDFVVLNQIEDFKFSEKIKTSVRNEFAKEKYSLSNGAFRDFLFLFRDKMVLVRDRNLKFRLDTAFSFLNNAMYSATNSDLASIKSSLIEFDLYVLENSLKNEKEFIEILNSYLEILSVFKSRDLEYQIYEHFIKKTDGNLSQIYETLDILKRNVYSSLDFSTALARESFLNYLTFLNANKANLKNTDKYKMFLNFQNQIFDNFLLRSEVFYDISFFEFKKIIEQDLLEIVDDDYLHNELIQAYISIKIDFLNRAWSFLKAERITLQTAKDVFSILFDDIKSLMQEDLISGLGVLDLFKRQLEVLNNQNDYLFNFQYNSSIIYGLNHEERFEAYLRDREIVPNLEAIFVKNFEEEKTLEVIKEELLTYLTNNNFSNVEFLDFENNLQRHVKIRANLSGYVFEAEFDRVSNSFKNVLAYEEVVSESPVRIANLESLFQRKFSMIDVEKPLDVEAQIESHAERVAKNFILNKVSTVGFVLKSDDISVLRSDTNVFRITNVSLPDKKDLNFTFDYSTRDEKVRNIYMVIDLKPIVLDGPFELEELKNMIISETDFDQLIESFLSDSFEEALGERGVDEGGEDFLDESLQEALEGDTEGGHEEASEGDQSRVVR